MDLDPQIVSASFTRPADTTQYAIGDLVANSTSAGSVSAMSWIVSPPYTRQSGYSPVYVSGVRLHASKASVTSAAFRVHLYSATPTFTSAGDNSAFGTVVATGNANWLASFDVTMVALHADGASGIAVPTEGFVVPQVPSGTTVYGLIEALNTYTPSSGETFTAELVCEVVRP